MKCQKQTGLLIIKEIKMEVPLIFFFFLYRVDIINQDEVRSSSDVFLSFCAVFQYCHRLVVPSL